ncbi:hypothetical protein F5Y16DRAFT_357491 [Xylariaceae sp. FL0255]|nr:hypothetical protein F5Y16DRAFT_357491 [Xylariaceae sp. FL0255]
MLAAFWLRDDWRVYPLCFWLPYYHYVYSDYVKVGGYAAHYTVIFFSSYRQVYQFCRPKVASYIRKMTDIVVKLLCRCVKPAVTSTQDALDSAVSALFSDDPLWPLDTPSYWDLTASIPPTLTLPVLPPSPFLPKSPLGTSSHPNSPTPSSSPTLSPAQLPPPSPTLLWALAARLPEPFDETQEKERVAQGNAERMKSLDKKKWEVLAQRFRIGSKQYTRTLRSTEEDPEYEGCIVSKNPFSRELSRKKPSTAHQPLSPLVTVEPLTDAVGEPPLTLPTSSDLLPCVGDIQKPLADITHELDPLSIFQTLPSEPNIVSNMNQETLIPSAEPLADVAEEHILTPLAQSAQSEPALNVTGGSVTSPVELEPKVDEKHSVTPLVQSAQYKPEPAVTGVSITSPVELELNVGEEHFLTPESEQEQTLTGEAVTSLMDLELDVAKEYFLTPESEQGQNVRREPVTSSVEPELYVAEERFSTPHLENEVELDVTDEPVIPSNEPEPDFIKSTPTFSIQPQPDVAIGYLSTPPIKLKQESELGDEPVLSSIGPQSDVIEEPSTLFTEPLPGVVQDPRLFRPAVLVPAVIQDPPISPTQELACAEEPSPNTSLKHATQSITTSSEPFLSDSDQGSSGDPLDIVEDFKQTYGQHVPEIQTHVDMDLPKDGYIPPTVNMAEYLPNVDMDLTEDVPIPPAVNMEEYLPDVDMDLTEDVPIPPAVNMTEYLPDVDMDLTQDESIPPDVVMAEHFPTDAELAEHFSTNIDMGEFGREVSIVEYNRDTPQVSSSHDVDMYEVEYEKHVEEYDPNIAEPPSSDVDMEVAGAVQTPRLRQTSAWKDGMQETTSVNGGVPILMNMTPEVSNKAPALDKRFVIAAPKKAEWTPIPLISPFPKEEKEKKPGLDIIPRKKEVVVDEYVEDGYRHKLSYFLKEPVVPLDIIQLTITETLMRSVSEQYERDWKEQEKLIDAETKRVRLEEEQAIKEKKLKAALRAYEKRQEAKKNVNPALRPLRKPPKKK